MDKNTVFSYTYSAKVNKEVQEIRKKYLPKEESKLEELKRLDRRVQKSGLIPSLTVGIIGFLLFGLGVCMTVQIIGESILLGMLLAIVGIGAMLFAYPVYRSLHSNTKEKLVPRILELSTELTGGHSQRLRDRKNR